MKRRRRKVTGPLVWEVAALPLPARTDPSGLAELAMIVDTRNGQSLAIELIPAPARPEDVCRFIVERLDDPDLASPTALRLSSQSLADALRDAFSEAAPNIEVRDALPRCQALIEAIGRGRGPQIKVPSMRVPGLAHHVDAFLSAMWKLEALIPRDYCTGNSPIMLQSDALAFPLVDIDELMGGVGLRFYRNRFEAMIDGVGELDEDVDDAQLARADTLPRLNATLYHPRYLPTFTTRLARRHNLISPQGHVPVAYRIFDPARSEPMSEEECREFVAHVEALVEAWEG